MIKTEFVIVNCECCEYCTTVDGYKKYLGGIHARPAAKIASTVMKHKCEVWLEKNNETAQADNMIDMFGLCLHPGDIVKVHCKGNNENLVLEELADTLIYRFGEELCPDFTKFMEVYSNSNSRKVKSFDVLSAYAIELQRGRDCGHEKLL